MVQTTANEIIEVKFQEIDAWKRCCWWRRIAETRMPEGPARNRRSDARRDRRRFWIARAIFSRAGQGFRKLDLLRGRMVVNLFFEASTRTRTSFEIAAKRLGADAISITAQAPAFRKANRWWIR